MPKKKSNKIIEEKIPEKKKAARDPLEEETPVGDEAAVDPAILEDTFTEEFSEYNDVDNF